MNSRVELEIIRLCCEAAPYLMPEQAIINQLVVRLRPPVPVAEIKTALRTLETNLQIAGQVTQDSGTVYQVTSRGKHRLFEAENV